MGRARSAGRRAMLALGLGLSITTGCTVGDRPAEVRSPPAPSPPPGPTRALVGWSEAMCAITKQVDGLHAMTDSVEQSEQEGYSADIIGSQAGTYVREVVSVVDSATRALAAVPASGIAAADAHVAQLQKVLKAVQERLPEDVEAITTASNKKKRAQAKQVADAVGTIPPQGPALTREVAGDRALAVSHDLALGCTPVTRSSPANGSAPTRNLVSWSDAMCQIKDSFESLPGDPYRDPLLKHPRFARFVGWALRHYISSTASTLNGIAENLSALPRTGIEDVDRYRSNALSAVERARAKLPDIAPYAMPPFPVGPLRKQARQVSRVIAGLSPHKELPVVVARHPALAASYDLAPRCEPLASPGTPSATPTPLPSARDGTRLAACRDGRCQVKVSQPVEVRVLGATYLLSAFAGRLAIVHDSSYMIIRPTGVGKFGKAGGKTTEFRVVAATPSGAVLDISTS